MRIKLWLGWLAMTAALTAFLIYSLRVERSPGRPFFLPGETTHGHYQIELACSACHTPMLGVQQEACLTCHAAELKAGSDTHPQSKFNDPTNAMRLAKLNAQNCITCHTEHVPERTHPMGLTLPKDYCFHCHESIGADRPSHADFAYNSCASAGCHNFHDNTALYESFLSKHLDEPDLLEDPRVPLRTSVDATAAGVLGAADHDAPPHASNDEESIADWAKSAHALAGVNCRACHEAKDEVSGQTVWTNRIGHHACEACHVGEVSGFLSGRHGMRLAQDLSPMTPAQARQPMHASAAHRELSCTSCHADHRFDTRYAAADACLSCHADEHSLAYKKSPHFALWQEELAGTAPAGSGVSCATCHLPRVADSTAADASATVQHNQNDNLRPNEKMIRSVCMRCHGVAYSIDALADRPLIDGCFDGRPADKIESIDMVRRWFQQKGKK
jgi:hypothetical protein